MMDRGTGSPKARWNSGLAVIALYRLGRSARLLTLCVEMSVMMENSR
jgi:hypothetical protein